MNSIIFNWITNRKWIHSSLQKYADSTKYSSFNDPSKYLVKYNGESFVPIKIGDKISSISYLLNPINADHILPTYTKSGKRCPTTNRLKRIAKVHQSAMLHNLIIDSSALVSDDTGIYNPYDHKEMTALSNQLILLTNIKHIMLSGAIAQSIFLDNNIKSIHRYTTKTCDHLCGRSQKKLKYYTDLYAELIQLQTI